MPAHCGEGAALSKGLSEQDVDACGKAISEECLSRASCSSHRSKGLHKRLTWLFMCHNSWQGLPLLLTWCLRRVQFGLVHVSAGDLLREEVAAGTAAGTRAKAFMDEGRLVPNEVVVGMVKARPALPQTLVQGFCNCIKGLHGRGAPGAH